MAKQKLIYKEPWQLMAERWEKYNTNPGRPTKGDLAAYKKFIKQAVRGKKKPRALVMGATPELRDLLYELKCEVTIIDAIEVMVKAMNGLRKYKEAKEKIVISDWIDNPLAAGYFDVIVGDIVLANIPREKQNDLLRGVARMLKPGGYFVSRFYVLPDKYKPITIEKFLEECEKNLPKHDNSAMEMLYASYLIIPNAKNKLLNMATLNRGIKKYWQKNKFVHPNPKMEYILNFMWETWKPMKKAWVADLEKDVAKLVSRYFTIKEKGFFTDVFWPEAAKIVPIWSCQVKK
ncbi:MAG: class I SAM-dependent methyltransferase [Patescibacteria group bacterium]|nr:class I SAM-dependent methyltransferase [Patescibacteria group bacterium]